MVIVAWCAAQIGKSRERPCPPASSLASRGGHRQLVGPVGCYEHGVIGWAGPHDPCQAAVAVPVIWFQVVNR
ncbi:MAG: hypothetical protein WCF33_08705, partial [Pseudonocardiaceae bacterium]